MKKIKKTISLLLTLMMLLSLGSFTAIADGDGQTDDKQGGGGAAEDISLTSSSPAGTIEMVSIIKNENDVQILSKPDQNAYVKYNSSDTSTIVNIDANIIAFSDGLYERNDTSDNLNVTVTGSIDSSSGSSDAVNVVNTAGTNMIKVDGSVTGAYDGIDAAVTGGSTEINVVGDVESLVSSSSAAGIKTNHTGTDSENLSITVGRTDEDGNVIVKSNVISRSNGINAINNSGNTNIHVTGDVTAQEDGITADNETGEMIINVDGSASGSSGIFSTNSNNTSLDKGHMRINVGKDIVGSVYSENRGTTEIKAGGNVEGNIKTQNDSGSTTISVDGSVTGNDADGINTNSRNTSETLTVNVGVVDNKGNTVVSSSVTGGQDGIEVLNSSGSTDISVTGNVEGKSGDGIRIVNGSYTLSYSEFTPEQIEGIITPSYGKNVTVTIGGSVKGAQDGIEVWDDTGSTTVTVNGDAIGETGAGVKLAVNDDNPTVAADGDCGSTILVGGNAEGKEAGILVEINSADDSKQRNAIVVEGTVSGDHAIKLNVAETVNEDAVIAAIPEIIVQTLDPAADMVAVIGGDKVDAEKVKQQVLDQVKYIVDTNVNTTQVDNLVIEIYTLTEDGGRAELDTESVTGKNLTVATTGTKLIVSATTGSLVGVSISTENNDNSVTYNEATGQYEITVGIGGGLKFTATPKKADNNNSDPKPDDKPKEETTARKENADTSATAANDNALISLDYKNHILTIDMTTTPAQIFLTDTICRFQRNGFETVVIKVANGSFTVAMDDLVQMIGTAFSFTLKVAGDTLSISAGGNEIATLVMA